MIRWKSLFGIYLNPPIKRKSLGVYKLRQIGNNVYPYFINLLLLPFWTYNKSGWKSYVGKEILIGYKIGIEAIENFIDEN